MPLKPIEIVFELDGSGLYYDPIEPLHLDALLAWCLAPFHFKGDAPARDEEPADIPLPLGRWRTDDTWGWCASALFPDENAVETIEYWRKRFRQSRADLTSGSPNLQMGIYREYNMPLPLLMTRHVRCYALGNKKRILHPLRKQVKYLGKKRAYGKGRVESVDAQVIDEDRSTVFDGKAMRFLPDPSGTRLCRPRPPYWNIHGRVSCCEVGSPYDANLLHGRR